MPQADTPLDTADLSTLADRQQARFTTEHGPVSVRRYARSSDFVRAAVRARNGRDRAALLTLYPGPTRSPLPGWPPSPRPPRRRPTTGTRPPPCPRSGCSHG
ncbi:MAG: hypothetical protein JF597_45830 [Streptomyces sp.]|uniref:hypothetical protein n=1 Tax=Streptomyces sp. TaxID=1931 RepID=UPI0025F2DD56|nr:hypothetical protein [Streptomyces sp.]MBW8800632.1 hypothetical protein [Streptomyces sp.]